MMSKIAFVTGGASGLGKAISQRLTKEGFTVAIADIDDAGARALADELGGDASAVHCDVADLSSVKGARDQMIETHGGIDLLVNNAGFDTPDFFLQTDPASWQRLLAVNLVGVLNCIHAIAPTVVERCSKTGYGRIINIASDAGRVGSMGEAVYSAAKGGVIAFGKSMARELSRSGVTVNSVCPGPAETPMTEGIRATELGEKMMQGLIGITPLRRLVQPEEVAAAVSYFAAEEARFTTGQSLSVSGGITMA